MTFQSLYYFLVIFEERSITAAAKRLFISQQTLSAQLQRLEEFCGTTLFIRKPVFRPTYAGEKLAIAAYKLLRIKKETLAEIKDISAGVKGNMLLGFSGIIAEKYLPDLLKKFNKRFPKIELIIKASDSKQMEEQLLDGKIDFYIGSSKKTTSEIEAIKLLDITLIAAVKLKTLVKYKGKNLDYWQKKAQSGLHLRDLQNIPLLLPHRGWRVRDSIDEYSRVKNIHFDCILESNQSIALGACKKGLGVGILYSTSVMEDYDKTNPLLSFPLIDMEHVIHTSICYRKDHFISEYEQYFMDLVQETFRK